MVDILFRVELDDKQFADALRGLRDANNRFAKEGDKAFQNIGKSADAAGVKIGVISGVVGELTRRLIDLGAAAVRAIGSVVTDSTKLAVELDSIEKSFGGIFQGNEQAAIAALKRIRSTSREIGVDLTELAQAFLPKVEDLDQFERVAKQAAALAIAQPEQGAIGARIALQEALAGDLRSLQRRFELDITPIRRAQEELGVTEGLIEGLDQILQETGRDLETLGDTAQAGFNRANESFSQLGASLGEPIVESLSEQFSTLNEFLGENFDDLQLVAGAIGDVVANVVDFVGTNFSEFLQNLDTEQLIDIANTFFDIVEDVRNLSEVLGLVEFPQKFIDALETTATKTSEILRTTVQLAAIAKAELAQLRAEEETTARFLTDSELASSAIGGFVFSRDLSEEEQAQVAAAGQKAFNEVIEEAAGILDESSQRTAENTERQQEREKAVRASTKAGEDQANQFLRTNQEEKRAADAAEELKEAQNKVNEAFDKLDTTKARKELDLAIKAEQAAIDAAEANARKREDIARDNARRIEDITRSNNNRVADATEDLAREQQETERSQARERAELERDLANERVDIETNFRRRIEDINRQFAVQAREAARTRDASAFLRAREQAQFDIGSAGLERERSLQDLQTEGERRRQELREQQEIEREEQRIANEQKLEDLEEQLERELEKQRISNERKLEDQRISEERKQQDLEQNQAREEERLRLFLQRQLENLNQNLSAELELIANAEAQKRQEFEATAAAAEEAAQRITQANQQAATGSNRSPINVVNPPVEVLQLQGGGPIAQGQPAVVGEAGPEVFVPGASGFVIPNNALPTQPFPMITQGMSNTNIDNSFNVDQSLLDPSQQAAQMRAIARNEMVQVFREAFGRRRR